MQQWESVKELQWFWTLSILLIKGNYFFGGVNEVTEYCHADILCIVYSVAGVCSVVL